MEHEKFLFTRWALASCLCRSETDQEFASVSLNWKPSLFETAAILGTLAGLLFLGAHIVDGLLLKGDGLNWLKIAVLTRIPRPYLGDGDNAEWARRKRKELETGEELRGPMHYEATDAIPWLREAEPPIPDELGEKSNELAEAGNGSSADPNQKELLDSWLKSTGHQEDDWAKRIARRQGKSRRKLEPICEEEKVVDRRAIIARRCTVSRLATYRRSRRSSRDASLRTVGIRGSGGKSGDYGHTGESCTVAPNPQADSRCAKNRRLAD